MQINSFLWLTLLYVIKYSHGIIFPFPSFIDPDTAKNLFELLETHDLVYENHTVVTEDKYHISAVRLPRARGEIPSNKKKPSVLLVTGYTAQPEIYLVQLNRSIAVLLTEAGFDVWIMASRGCELSLKHDFLTTKDREYWDFSFHEISYYDIPAYMDHIRNVTGNEKISYIGHSMGAVIFFSFAVTRPEYLKRIDSAHVWAPVIYADYARTKDTFIITNWKALNLLYNFLGQNKGTGQFSQFNMWLSILYCNVKSPYIDKCIASDDGFGPDHSQVDKSKLTVFKSNDPSGSSFKTYIHILQILKSGKFQYYDYESKNMKKYGQFTPPLYNFSSISGEVPITITYGLNDYFAGAKDYERLVAETPGAVGHIVPYPFFNHIDFIRAKDAKELLYDDCISKLKVYATC